LLSNRKLNSKSSFFKPIHPIDLSLKAVGINSQAIKKGVARILEAKQNKEKVVVFGDYDVDGICATAILWSAIYQLGIDVIPFIPHREKHGYGLSKLAILDLLKIAKPNLIITVDNGIVAHDTANFIKQKKIDLIISDHHQAEEQLPAAFAIIHTTKLCGATLAWMLARELLKTASKKISQNWQLDLAAVATIADQVPLRGANRSFAKYGISVLQKSRNLGLKALIKSASLDQNKIGSQEISFAIAPRINAIGRLGNSLNALRLVLTTNASRAQQLATKLTSVNSKRQDITQEMLNHSLELAKNFKKNHLIIVHSPTYHEGIIGLIAGRLAEKYHKPAIAMSVGKKTTKASARSILGVNIVELIREIRQDLIDVGGHPMAAGFELDSTKLEVVCHKLLKLSLKKIKKEMLVPKIVIDLILPHELLNIKTFELLQALAPFGQGNQEPVFGLQDIKVHKMQLLGNEGQHLKIIGSLGTQSKSSLGTPLKQMEFLAWKKGSWITKIKPNSNIALAGVLEINQWKGRKKLQVRVLDIKLS
jgi:single-stranded-DNA-specific exonuclease